jgi:hypothetical protein
MLILSKAFLSKLSRLRKIFIPMQPNLKRTVSNTACRESCCTTPRSIPGAFHAERKPIVACRVLCKRQAAIRFIATNSTSCSSLLGDRIRPARCNDKLQSA